METLSHILASFDIFQVIIDSFPQIFNPILHAFESMFGVLFNYGKNMVTAHPGLIAGICLYLLGYISVTAYHRLRRVFSTPVPAPQKLSK